MVNLTVSLAGVELKNPVIPASGTFGYGREYAELYDLNILGSFSWKGTTGAARLGNPQPRIAEAPSGMLNAVGLQNPGIDAVIAEEVPNIAKIFQGPVIANIGGFSIDEYAPPIYVLSVNSFLVSPDGTTKNIGRTTYKLNYETKEAWLLTLKKPEWFPITTATASSRDVFNKLFMKAFGIPFIAEPE